MIEPKPCPFCGRSLVLVQEGTTFRWCRAVCEYCDAHGPEVRGRLDSKSAVDRAQAKDAAITAWNDRP